MKTTLDGDTAVSTVTFDNTRPLLTNLNSVITNMTDHYIFRSS
jgi:hypothetical protein